MSRRIANLKMIRCIRLVKESKGWSEVQAVFGLLNRAWKISLLSQLPAESQTGQRKQRGNEMMIRLKEILTLRRQCDRQGNYQTKLYWNCQTHEGPLQLLLMKAWKSANRATWGSTRWWIGDFSDDSGVWRRSWLSIATAVEAWFASSWATLTAREPIWRYVLWG